MRSFKTVFSICAQNFRKWRTDRRVWCIGLILTVMVAIYVDDFRKVNEVTNTGVPVWVFPFLYSQFYTKLIFLLPMVLLFCNAPFTDRNQTFVYMRTGRVKWLCGQLLYIVFASAAYFLFLLVLSVLFTVISGGELSVEWGDTLKKLSSSDIFFLFETNTPYLNIFPIVLKFFSPLQAVWFTFLLSWLGGVFLGFTVFACNLLSGTKSAGIIVASVAVVFSSAVELQFGELIRFSPISWTTLDNIDVGGMTKNPPFYYCLSVYLALNVVLTALILVFGRKKSLDVKE